jgi:hypothetical protein
MWSSPDVLLSYRAGHHSAGYNPPSRNRFRFRAARCPLPSKAVENLLSSFRVWGRTEKAGVRKPTCCRRPIVA